MEMQIRLMIEKERELAAENSKYKEEIDYVNMAYGALEGEKTENETRLQARIADLQNQLQKQQAAMVPMIDLHPPVPPAATSTSSLLNQLQNNV